MSSMKSSMLPALIKDDTKESNDPVSEIIFIPFVKLFPGLAPDTSVSGFSAPHSSKRFGICAFYQTDRQFQFATARHSVRYDSEGGIDSVESENKTASNAIVAEQTVNSDKLIYLCQLKFARVYVICTSDFSVLCQVIITQDNLSPEPLDLRIHNDTRKKVLLFNEVLNKSIPGFFSIHP